MRWMLVLVLVSACGSHHGDAKALPKAAPDAGNPAASARVPAIPKTDGTYASFEGTEYKNACTTDAECFTGGCKGEVCSAQNDIVSACDILPNWPRGDVACGCVSGECIWFRAEGTPAATTGAGAGAAQGKPCPDGACATGLQCITYYGVAGPRGPAFTSCEIPCPQGQCPSGQSCVSIKDGPGRVCR